MSEALLSKFSQLNVWKSGDKRAPYKPLLALWAIGRCLRGEERLVEYQDLCGDLLHLMKQFGPYREQYHPNEPFWRMQKDDVWEIPLAHSLSVDRSGGVSEGRLRKAKLRAGFPVQIYEKFTHDREAAFQIALQLIQNHFPESLYDHVLEATLGIDFSKIDDVEVDSSESLILQSIINRRKRNPSFRNDVLKNYGYKCAVCSFSMEFPAENWPALEAAHIKWHSYRGPDKIENGLSLCSVHHELFDWGAFTIVPQSLELVAAEQALERDTRDWIRRFHRKPLIAPPVQDKGTPDAGYLRWHANNVFKDTVPR